MGTELENAQGWTVVHNPSVARSLDAALARKLLNGRSVLLVGDSVTMHGAFALASALATGRWVLPFNTSARPLSWVTPAMTTVMKQYSEVERVAFDYNPQITDCVVSRDNGANSHHWLIGASDEHPSFPAPGTRLSFSIWRGDFNTSDEASSSSGVQACLTDPFNRALERPTGARTFSSAEFKACRTRILNVSGRCSEANALRLPIAQSVRRLLDELAPDVLVINNGLWYSKYWLGNIPPETVTSLADTIRAAIASRAKTSRPLRVVWKATTYPWKWKFSFDRRKQADIEAALVAVGAEIFNASSDLSQELLGNDEVASAGFMDGFHLGAAVHAEINARLLMHLARGWGLHNRLSG